MATVLAALAAVPAGAGVKLQIRSQPAAGAQGKPVRYEVWLDGKRLAVELARADGTPARRRIVFRGGDDVAWLVDHQKQTYYQVDPTSAQQVASQVAGLRQGLEQGLEALTPEQREAVGELLGELAKPRAGLPPGYALREKGELGRYADLPCTRHDVMDGERTVAEVCLADYGKPPLTREALAAIPALGGFLRHTLEPLAREFPSLSALMPYAALDAGPGVPLFVRSADEKGKTTETIVKRIEQAPVDPQLFELPAGYARSWIPPFR